jgi:hypothetical protein
MASFLMKEQYPGTGLRQFLSMNGQASEAISV